MPVLNSQFKIDAMRLHKGIAVNKICQAIDFADEHSKSGLQKFASNDGLIQLFSQMLEQLSLKVGEGEAQDLVRKLSAKCTESGENIKSGNRETNVKIVSKALKDSHYQVDVSKGVIIHKGRKVLMVSCYARDAYLGRYLIKRNYFFTTEREASANDAYDEIVKKVDALKDRYYNEILDVAGIFAQTKRILDGVVSEVEFNDDEFRTRAS